MKQTLNWLFSLLTLTILNLAFFLALAFAMAWGEPEMSELVLYFLPNTLVALIAIIFAIVGKKKGKRGALWLPLIVSYAIAFVEYALLVEIIAPKMIRGNSMGETVLILVAIIIPLLALYLILRKYYMLSKKSALAPN
jgi:hypothetical protein